MEPTQTTIIYRINTTVRGVSQRTEAVYVTGQGKEAVFSEVVKGWYVHFDGSRESIYLGMEKPDLEIGSEVEITIKRRK